MQSATNYVSTFSGGGINALKTCFALTWARVYERVAFAKL